MSTAQATMDKNTTELLEKTGAFFAFSDYQFDKKKEHNVKYTQLGGGLIIPVDAVKQYLEERQKMVTDFLKQDIEENGKDAIIERKLRNYECFYIMDISDALPVLKDYGFTEAEVMAVFLSLKNNEEF